MAEVMSVPAVDEGAELAELFVARFDETDEDETWDEETEGDDDWRFFDDSEGTT